MTDSQRPWVPMGEPTGEAARVYRAAEEEATRFAASPFSAGLSPRVADVAVHSMIVWHGASGGPLADFRAFDTPGYLDWLPSISVLHPTVVPALYRCWERVAAWMAIEGRTDEAAAARLLRELGAGEEELFHRVVDGFLRWQRDVPLAS